MLLAERLDDGQHGLKKRQLTPAKFCPGCRLAQSNVDKALRPQWNQEAALVLVTAIAIPASVVLAVPETAGGQVAQTEHPEFSVAGGGQVKGIQQECAPDKNVEGRGPAFFRYLEIFDHRQVGTGVYGNGCVVERHQLPQHIDQQFREISLTNGRKQSGEVLAVMRECGHDYLGSTSLISLAS